MSGHLVYRTIIEAFRAGKLKEPFTSKDLKHVCPSLPDGTCNTFPRKHRNGNPGRNSELFEMVSKGKFKLLKPFKYGL